MDLLGDSIKCTSCLETLKAPLILPCGHCICKQHEDFQKDRSKRIFCVKCVEFYPIPLNGFVRVKPLESLLEKGIDSIDLGEEYNLAKDKCQLFSDLLEQLNTLKNDPEMKIHTVISELRNKVDLKREELKSQIDKEALDTIKKLDEFEKECKSNSRLVKFESDLTSNLNSWRTELNKWQQSLNTFKKDSEKWKSILNKSSLSLKELQSEIIKFNDKLFLNRLNELNRLEFINSSNFLFISVCNTFDPISFEVTELSKYQKVKDLTRINSHSGETLGINWFLSISIENERFMVDIHALQISSNRKIKVEFYIVILDQLNMNKSRIESFVKEFNSSYSNFKMMNLKDIMDNYNLYNVQNDSCTIQVLIKNVEWL